MSNMREVTKSYQTGKDVSEAASKAPFERMGTALDEIARLESDIGFLEQAIPPLQAKLDAAVVPLIEQIILVRRDLVSLVQRLVSDHAVHRTLRRDGQELVHHIASDLEERFGVPARELLGEEDSEEEGEENSDDFSWSDHGFRASREQLAPVRKRAAPTTPESAAKDIYRNLARELHPDKTRDESLREDRTRAMQELTVAWGKRDIGALLRLLHVHGSDETKADSLDGPSLQACLQGLESRCLELRQRQKDLRHRSLPDGAVDWMLLAKEPKVFERILRKRKAPAREELHALLHWKAKWTRPGGIAEFLREFSPQEWMRMI